jgi:hypothetical protein
MESGTDGRERLEAGLQPASQGVGRLQQRDYWGVIRGCRYDPASLTSYVRRHFAELPPEPLARFRETGGGAPLSLGDELEIALPGAGKVGVRVVHVNARSFTVATLRGHPIAGRITFGAYPNDRGDVLFHIRSRARFASTLQRLGHFLAGAPMQSTTWTDFIDRLAHTVGDGVIGSIHDELTEIPPGMEPPDLPLSPTFIAEDSARSE